MGFSYVVMGAGRQGLAAAYDLAALGDAEEVLVADADARRASETANRVNSLLGREVARGAEADAADMDQVAVLFQGAHSAISCVPYRFNLSLARAAVEAGTNFCDLGGNTDVVREQLKLDPEARERGVTVVPDCGMGPGLNVCLAVYAMSLLDAAEDVYIWDGGIPQFPRPPWNYTLTFNIGGLTNEYAGPAYFIREGRVTEVPCLGELETLDFPDPVGRLEAAVTAGGLSTAPWTFEGKLRTLENKTLRHPGHWERFRAFADLGLLGLEPLRVGDAEVVPREVLHALLGPKISAKDVRDYGIIRVRCVGVKGGRPWEAVVEVIDRYEERTGFTAMQRLTGWHASMAATLAARGRLPEGAVPVESALPGDIVVQEVRRRGIEVRERTGPPV